MNLVLFQFGCSADLGNRLRFARNMIQKLLLTKSGSSNKAASGSGSGGGGGTTASGTAPAQTTSKQTT